jgi:hypothetical protein
MFYNIIESWHKVFPNPADNTLTIEIDQNKIPENIKNKTLEIRLYDKMMNLIKIERNVLITTNIKVTDLEAGIYILHIIFDKNII